MTPLEQAAQRIVAANDEIAKLRDMAFVMLTCRDDIPPAIHACQSFATALRDIADMVDAIIPPLEAAYAQP